MIVTLDGNRIAPECSPAATLQCLVDQVSGSLSSDRLVVGIARDGQDLVDDRLEAALLEPLDDGMQVDLSTADRRELAAGALRHVSAQIAQVGEQQPRIAAQLTGGDAPRAIQQFSGFLEVWQTSQRTLAQCCHILKTNLALHEFQGQPVTAHLSELAVKLREVRQALEATDMVLLADLLEYELPSTCRHWSALMTDMAARLELPIE
jgi:hypothetical protein